jgi:Zn-dependent protease
MPPLPERDLMERHSIRIFSLYGIAVRLHVSWLFIFVLLTWTLVARFSEQPRWSNELCWLAGVVTSVLFFVSVLLHELAHSVVAIDQGMRVRNIVLFIFGGVAEITDEPQSPGTEFLMSIAGPMMSFAIAAVTGVVWWFGRGIAESVAVPALYLAKINLVLGIFNLIPGFPLDGGRVLRSMIWAATRNLLLATRWATRTGMAVGFLFIAIGIWQFFGPTFINGIWLVFIGWFLAGAAQAAYNRAALREAVRDRTVRQVLPATPDFVTPDTDLATVVDAHVVGRNLRSLAVVEGGCLCGLLTIEQLKTVPRNAWAITRAADVMTPCDRLRAIHPEAELWTAFELMASGDTTVVAVIESDGRFVGLLDRDAVLAQLDARAQLGL